MNDKSGNCSDKRIGVFGFGCVGQGLYDVLQHDERLSLQVAGICVKDPNKQRALPAALFTYNPQELLQDASINLFAELISNPQEALAILKQALKEGKTVISANKKVIAENLPALVELQKEHGSTLLYEAAVCGSIPILRTLEAYYGTEPLQEVSGILNGSSNYILTKLEKEGLNYKEALRQAQELGFAEADPSLDVQGHDALHKLCILTAHAFGTVVKLEDVLRFGIAAVSEQDITLAQALGARLKLVASAKLNEQQALEVQVLPTFVFPENELYFVDYEFNGVQIDAKFAGTQFLKGRGAGSHPTGSAVWADVAAACRGYRYLYQKLKNCNSVRVAEDGMINIYLRTNTGKPLSALSWEQVTLISEHKDSTQMVGTLKRSKLLKYQSELEEAGAFISYLPDFAAAKVNALTKAAALQDEAII